jgi:hypothetical protein
MRIFEITLGLLGRTDWDTALKFGDSTFILMRRAGELVLNSSIEFWIPNHLAMVKLPYKLEDIPKL